MRKTILITGASTGIGRAAAKLFHEKGWNVIATMRTPEKEEELNKLENIMVEKLDVTDLESIDNAVKAGIDNFGKIDVLLNNAGYGAYGPLEAFPRENILRQFNTNVIGLLDVTRALIPHFRANNNGVIVNVSSIGGKMTFPLGSLYHGTKFAVEGISESLSFEMGKIGVQVKIVEPGMVSTDFGGRSFDFQNDESLVQYQESIQKFFAALGAGGYSSEPELIADVIYQAATDETGKLRFEAGPDAVEIIDNRRKLDDATFMGGIKEQTGF